MLKRSTKLITQNNKNITTLHHNKNAPIKFTNRLNSKYTRSIPHHALSRTISTKSTTANNINVSKSQISSLSSSTTQNTHHYSLPFNPKYISKRLFSTSTEEDDNGSKSTSEVILPRAMFPPQTIERQIKSLIKSEPRLDDQFNQLQSQLEQIQTTIQTLTTNSSSNIDLSPLQSLTTNALSQSSIIKSNTFQHINQLKQDVTTTKQSHFKLRFDFNRLQNQAYEMDYRHSCLHPYQVIINRPTFQFNHCETKSYGNCSLIAFFGEHIVDYDVHSKSHLSMVELDNTYKLYFYSKNFLNGELFQIFGPGTPNEYKSLTLYETPGGSFKWTKLMQFIFPMNNDNNGHQIQMIHDEIDPLYTLSQILSFYQQSAPYSLQLYYCDVFLSMKPLQWLCDNIYYGAQKRDISTIPLKWLQLEQEQITTEAFSKVIINVQNYTLDITTEQYSNLFDHFLENCREGVVKLNEFELKWEYKKNIDITKQQQITQLSTILGNNFTSNTNQYRNNITIEFPIVTTNTRTIKKKKDISTTTNKIEQQIQTSVLKVDRTMTLGEVLKMFKPDEINNINTMLENKILYISTPSILNGDWLQINGDGAILGNWQMLLMGCFITNDNETIQFKIEKVEKNSKLKSTKKNC